MKYDLAIFGHLLKLLIKSGLEGVVLKGGRLHVYFEVRQQSKCLQESSQVRSGNPQLVSLVPIRSWRGR